MKYFLMKLSKAGFYREIIILLILLFVYNNFLYKKNTDRKEVFISSDGRGYYEYLPALFIYNDLHFSYIDTLQTEFYEAEHNKLIYSQLDNGQRINKYFVGTAVLQAPFFLVAHAIASGENSAHPPDGFSLTYQKGMLYAGIFYLFLGLVFIRLLLQTYHVNGWWIFFIQLATLFATPLLNYTMYDSAYSHVYSFFLVSWFLYVVRKYFLSGRPGYLVVSLIALGFIVIVRPVNVLVLIFTPLLVESFGAYIQQVRLIFQKHLIPLLIGSVLLCLLFSLQLYVSFLQTGNPLNYNYGDEGFNFTNPAFFRFLFSYWKGFFLWTPWWLLVFVTGIIYWIYQKKYYHAIAFILSFTILVYVLSSWHAWSYGGSIGQRPMIDFYAVFILLFVPVFSEKMKTGKWLLAAFFPVLAVVMQVQIFQYQRAIIPWDGTTREMYWKVFLNTNEKYSWYFWRKKLEVGDLQNDTLLCEEWKTTEPVQSVELPLFDIPVIDSLSGFGEITFELDREADNEFADFWLMDSLGNNILYNQSRIFIDTYDDGFVYRFPIPEGQEQAKKLKIVLNRIDSPLKIFRIKFATYYSLN